ncbi:MAG: PIG-L family deacetylase [Bacteroidales bacterium]|nr:PIG-L family deacetylase [Bacteroidales bacterium]
MNRSVLAFFAHPDDAEILCAGTLSLLKKAGYNIHFATIALGDKGTATHSKEEIISIRRAEAIIAAGIIGGSYHCLDFEDIYIFYQRESIDKASALVRKLQPAIVFTHSPDDYMLDHELTSKIVQTACFTTGMKNLAIPEKPFGPVPYLYYTDAVESKDKFGKRIESTSFVDITAEIYIKEEMLASHASQRDWLMSHHKVDEYLLAMKSVARSRGEESGFEYAEGFRQHLGHGFPQDNVLLKILDKKTTKLLNHIN